VSSSSLLIGEAPQVKYSIFNLNIINLTLHYSCEFKLSYLIGEIFNLNGSELTESEFELKIYDFDTMLNDHLF
jgi:hypothetical protein